MAVEYQVKYTPGFDPTIVNVSQNDVGRQFDLKIIDETGAEQQIPSGSTVKFVGMKPSGLGFTVDCTFTNSVVHVTTTDIMTDEHGLIPAEVQITNGNTVIGTANVNLRVEKNPHPEGTIDDNLIRIIPTFEVIYQRLDILESSMYTAENNITNLQTRVGIAEVKADDAYNIASQASDMASAHAVEIGGIKRGYDGTVYQTAGDAVRAQAMKLDSTLTESGKAADAAATGGEINGIKADISILSGDVNLDVIAYGNKTYREIFETANIIPDGDFENGLDWITTNTNGATITNEQCVSKTHSLKCFGSSSVQIRKDIEPFDAGSVYTACKLYVTRRSAGNCGFTTSFSTNYALNEPTDGFVTVSTIKEVTQQTTTQSLFFGTYANANADVYVDDATCIHLTNLFGESIPTKSEMDSLFNTYIKIKNAVSNAEFLENVQTTVENLSNTVSSVATDVKALNGSSDAFDAVALNGKTYREIFITGNNVPYADFENGSLDWVTTSTGNPVITDETSVSKNHSLKCFGTSSSQIRKDFPSLSAGTIYIACKLRVDRYAAGNCGFSTTSGFGSLNGTVTQVTDGFVTVSGTKTISAASTAQSLWFGTYSSANADVYVDDGMFINLTSVFGENLPTKAEVDTAYDEFLTIKNKIYKANLVSVLDAKIDNAIPKPIFVGAVLDATSGANRYAAMRELYTVAQKVLDDPSYVTSDSDLTYASKGAVCVLPQYPAGMYQEYPINVLYAKSGDTASIPASTTKVMTLITGLDYIPDMFERITIVSDDIEDGSSSLLTTGDVLTIHDLVYAMMLVSSNTAAVAFARVAGDKILTAQGDSGTHTPAACQTAFLAEMANKAALLGMDDSAFYSPSGRLITNQMTAKDMLKMTIEACSYPQIQKIWNKKTQTIAVGGTDARSITLNTTVADASLESLYYIFGGKTGTLSLDGGSAIALVMVAQAN